MAETGNPAALRRALGGGVRTAPSAGAVAGLLLSASLAWLVGVGLQLQLPDLPDIRTLWANTLLAMGLSLGGAWTMRSLQHRAPFHGGRFASMAVLCGAALWGWAATGLQAASGLADRLPSELEGRDLVVTGVVADLPQSGPNGLRFRFETEAAQSVGEPVRLPARLALGWYIGRHEDAALSPPQASLRAGQRWTFTLRLRRPHGNLNPHGFDYELSLFEQGIGATGYVRDGPARPQMLAAAAGRPVARLRQEVRDAIYARVEDRRAAGMLAALAIGDQSAIARDDWELFRNTGIAHLVSISGLHVTMFAWLSAAAIAAVWRRSPTACLWLATPHAARWGGLIVATGYAVIAGWGVPAQRTVAMLALVGLLTSLGLRWPWGMVLLAAAVGVSVLDPWALLQPGFWLSFVAVGLLMASDPAQAVVPQAPVSEPAWRASVRHIAQVLRQALHTQWIATLGLTPLSLVFFQQVSLVGVLANLVAIPLVTLVITPLALLGVAWAPLWQVGAWVVQGLVALLGAMAAWPMAVWTVAAAPVWAQWAGLAAAAVLIFPWPWRLRLLALPLALPLLLPPKVLPAEGRFELIAVDVGQGTAVLLRTRNHLLLFDAGPQYSRDSDAGQRVLLPLLRGRGERRIDRLVLSHRDDDHVGGARTLLQALPVGELIGSLEATHPLLALGVPHRRCVAGERWRWDGVDFEFLHPDPQDYLRPLKPNAMSCVLRVAGTAPGSGSVLLTGDIERAQELALLSARPAALRSSVLIVPHHGSKTSSTAAFLAAVDPDVAVFQAGYRNHFGHPAPEVLARYRAQGIRLIDSPGCGAWWWQGDVAVVDAVCERERVRRHWHDDGTRGLDPALHRPTLP